MTVSAPAARSLLQELESARTESDRLFRIIKRGAIYERPIDARHRVIFYIGHLDSFDSIQICREALGIRSPDAALDQLFQAGIDPDASHLPNDNPSDWPSLVEVEAYVRRCRDMVDEYARHVPPDVLQLAVEHRLMHLETLAYMFHNFSHELKLIPEEYKPLEESHEFEKNSWRQIRSGEAVLGKRSDAGFGWDNEYEEVRSSVPSFQIQRYPVTNGEYLQFVQAGGPSPHFWTERNGSIYYRGMFEQIPLPLDWPVYVTHTQAQLYAAWAGAKLPSEEQFHRAAYGSLSEVNREYPWGDEEPEPRHGNFDFRRWDPEPVDATPAGDSAFGVAQLVGNGWEWTNSVFAPFPGFQPRDSYPGYSANFFDGEHFVLKGGSARTASLLLRGSFRNWFRRDYAYMYAKFRCVRDVE